LEIAGHVDVVMLMHRWLVRENEKSVKDTPDAAFRSWPHVGPGDWQVLQSAASASPSLICRRPSNLYRISFGLTLRMSEPRSRENRRPGLWIITERRPSRSGRPRSINTHYRSAASSSRSRGRGRVGMNKQVLRQLPG